MRYAGGEEVLVNDIFRIFTNFKILEIREQEPRCLCIGIKESGELHSNLSKSWFTPGNSCKFISRNGKVIPKTFIGLTNTEDFLI